METKIVFDANVAYGLLIAGLKAGVSWFQLRVWQDAFRGQQFSELIFNAVEPIPGTYGQYILPEKNLSLIYQCMFGK